RRVLFRATRPRPRGDAVKLPGILTSHTVTCRDKTGDGTYGPVYAGERTIPRCRVEDKTHLVRDKDGAEVVSSAVVWVRPEHGPVPVGSLVTLPHGRTAEVLATDWFETPPAPEHYVLHLK